VARDALRWAPSVGVLRETSVRRGAGNTCTDTLPRVCSNDRNRYCTEHGDCDGGTCNAGAIQARVQQLSFDTPYGATSGAECGRVAYSSLHVAGASNVSSPTFPGYCSNASLTAQELVLAFMLFDLDACLSDGRIDPPSTCTPITKDAVCTTTATCGSYSDGCGGLIACDACTLDGYCSEHACMPTTCMPETCESLGYECGVQSDQCGGIADRVTAPASVDSCGTCSGALRCFDGRCVACTPEADPCMGAAECGQIADSCGNPVMCGDCFGHPENCSANHFCELE